ncbi:MAG: hypothetical protein KGD70_00005 [Candidatus Lokiarchaeota archaeon]|nr:hypothetical protein [Candidatus Lokiarchaeota archaeon]
MKEESITGFKKYPRVSRACVSSRRYEFNEIEKLRRKVSGLCSGFKFFY